ncbi:hypothetical protein LTR37_011939 [Vermiconidia calcicola]|uniref:Uncharacterized protein n=1 Tax=Vermiconidia calcicola TaxID=1690605 RepID=A0ACC3N233_9PEZI|nr:hypothetical protein LTR37_011939 [Vermiconidia calcicola]
MERPAKRQRTTSTTTTGSPLTPPATDFDVDSTSTMLGSAIHVLATQAAAVSNISNLYRTSATARQGLVCAVEAVVEAHRNRGKLIVCGVGKSAYIGMKLVATLKSLGVGASFMHACEAAHGDLGDIRPDDVLLFVSYSGRTPELLNVLPHIPAATQVMAMSSHSRAEECPLLLTRSLQSTQCLGDDGPRNTGILIPTPIPESEESSFGLSAPTTSTTVALAVADMLALTISEQIHDGQQARKAAFRRNHPGGAIGMNHEEVESLKKDGIQVSLLELPSPSISGEDT